MLRTVYNVFQSDSEFRKTKFLTNFQYFSVFFALCHFVSHAKIPFCFKAKWAKLTFSFAKSLRSFSLPFRFVSLRSEMWDTLEWSVECEKWRVTSGVWIVMSGVWRGEYGEGNMVAAKIFVFVIW